jgi:hypothetical protein
MRAHQAGFAFTDADSREAPRVPKSTSPTAAPNMCYLFRDVAVDSPGKLTVS